MHCLYISLLVCVAGTATVGATTYHKWDRELSMNAHHHSGLQKRSVIQNVTLSEETKDLIADIVVDLVKIAEGNLRSSGESSEEIKDKVKEDKRFFQSAGLLDFSPMALEIVSPLQMLQPGFHSLPLLPSVSVLHPVPVLSYYRRAGNNPLHDDTPVHGSAQIIYNDETICTGTFLKPWILLTTAECVEGHDKNDVHVVANVQSGQKVVIRNVEVFDVIIDPKYKGGDPEYNLAVLIIYGQDKWDVSEFILPEHDYTPDKIINSNLHTYVTEWNPKDLFDYESVRERVSVTTNYKLCGSLKAAKRSTWYCVLPKNGRHSYTEVDVGSPFFANRNGNRYCLGIYTGLKLGKDTPGALYLSIYPSIEFIRLVVHENPVPPA